MDMGFNMLFSKLHKRRLKLILNGVLRYQNFRYRYKVQTQKLILFFNMLVVYKIAVKSHTTYWLNANGPIQPYLIGALFVRLMFIESNRLIVFFLSIMNGQGLFIRLR